MTSKAAARGLLLVAGLSACVAPPEAPSMAPTDPERQAIADTIRDRMASYAVAVGSLDGDAILAHYVDSPEFRLYSDGQAFSYGDMQTLAGALGQVLKASEISWDTVEVTVLGRDAAIAGAPFHRADTDTAGVVTRVRGTVSWVWVRDGHGWRTIHGHAVHLPDTISK